MRGLRAPFPGRLFGPVLKGDTMLDGLEKKLIVNCAQCELLSLDSVSDERIRLGCDAKKFRECLSELQS